MASTDMAGRGMFITFEGGEGCGKSTQVKRFAARLEASGRKVLLTREPGGTRLSELVRSLLKDEREDPPCDRAELLLFLAARAQLVNNVVLPALEAGTWVVSDRFSDSTFAYQGYGRGLPLDVLRMANDFACAGLRPDRTVLLDADPAVTLARMRSREAATATEADRIEPDRISVVDASGTPEEVEGRIWKSLKLSP